VYNLINAWFVATSMLMILPRKNPGVLDVRDYAVDKGHLGYYISRAEPKVCNISGHPRFAT
jgi:hypothetical protein